MKGRFVVAIGAAFTVGCAAVIGLGDYEITGDDAGVASADGATVVDSSVIPAADTATPVVENTPHFCTQLDAAATFCADFDNPNDPSPTYGWDPLELDAGATLETVTEPALSPPRAMHAHSSADKLAVVAKAILGPRIISLEADMLLPKLPDEGAAVAAFAIQPPDDPELHIWFFVSGNKGNHYFQRGSDEFSPRGAPKYPLFEVGIWHHVSMTVHFDATETRIDGSLDGLAHWENYKLGRTYPLGGYVTVLAGAIPYMATSGDVWIDNVVIRAE